MTESSHFQTLIPKDMRTTNHWSPAQERDYFHSLSFNSFAEEHINEDTRDVSLEAATVKISFPFLCFLLMWWGLEKEINNQR